MGSDRSWTPPPRLNFQLPRPESLSIDLCILSFVIYFPYSFIELPHGWQHVFTVRHKMIARMFNVSRCLKVDKYSKNTGDAFQSLFLKAVSSDISTMNPEPAPKG
jgi:hypothetical protein